jgi:hypothetical protein
MSLLPYGLRPKVVFRGLVIRRGVMGGSPFWRPIAMLLVGQGDFLRARALRHGVFLGSRYWRVIGVVVLMQEIHKQVIGRQPEHLAVDRLRAGDRLQLTVSQPNLKLSRRARRRALSLMRAEAEATVAAAHRSS